MEETVEREIRIEAFLGIASILMLLGSLAPWETVKGVGYSALNSWHGTMAFVGAMIVLVVTTVSYGIYQSDFLQSLRPFIDGILGGVGSTLALIAGFAFFDSASPGAVPAWGLYLTIGGGLLGLLSAFGLCWKGPPPRPEGLSEKESF